MSLVLDSSVALAWIYSDETTEWISMFLNVVSKTGAWVPAIWRLRSPTFLKWVSAGGARMPHFATPAWPDCALPISLDLETHQQAWGATALLATRRRLTLYDAVYLELAQRRRLPLATLDRELRAAARDEGVALLGGES